MDEIEEIKRKIDIVDFISGYLTVKKAGANYRALCPFHQEKTPSMMISPEKQIWKCFGCQAGGSVFDFVMQMENLEFREALEMLAQKAGVKLEKFKSSPQYQKEKDAKTRLYQINHWSARLFQEILLKHPSAKAALEYLTQKRKLSLETIKIFELGYAPSNSILKQFLKKKGYTDAEIQSAGGPDRFYRRIIFPIRDVMGNTIGFTGRATSDDQEPKYLNTPETIIFHKGRILYNLDKARGDIKLEKTTLVVEGQMDVISSYQAGVKNVVATSGTALTQEHLQILYRYTPNIVFAFDSDTAGMATSKKAYEMAIQEGMNVKMVELGQFKDPGEMAAESAELWQKAVKEAKPVIDWYFNLAFSERSVVNGELSPQAKKEIAKELLPIIKKIPDTIEQAHYAGLLAKKLGISEQVIFDAINKIQDTRNSSTALRAGKIQTNSKSQSSNSPHLSPEEILVGLLFMDSEILPEVMKKIKPDDLNILWNRQLYTKIVNWYNDKGSLDLDGFQKKLSNEDSKQLELILLEIKESYPDPKPVINDICTRLNEQKMEKVKKHYAAAIAEAEEKGDRIKIKELVKEFQNEISKRGA